MNNTVLLTMSLYYPLAEAPHVCLTQDLPPEQNADILLLGCGDARTILFTCFAESSRKIDVTCCDIEPGIHARNILLYTLLIDDEEDCNIECIWNIYHHWKIDKDSQKLLEKQTLKLLKVSDTIDKWQSSIYGSCIRFCDIRSLLSVRNYWLGYTSKSLSATQEQDRQNQMQAAISRARSYRRTRLPQNSVNISGLRAIFPVITGEGLDDLSNIDEQWWSNGTVSPRSASSSKPVHLNPTFLYSPNKGLLLHYSTSPIHGVPLSLAYTPIMTGSTLFPEIEGLSMAERLINCAKNQFKLWASAFRRAVAKKSVIRIFAGDALNFCLTLRHCKLTQSTSIHLFCDMWTNMPLNLLHSEYGQNSSTPKSFDVIDTSTLAEHFGALSYLAVGSSLLKQQPSSSLYTKMMIYYDADTEDRLTKFFGVDARTISLFLGLVPPNLFTNASNNSEVDLFIGEIFKSTSAKSSEIPARTRLRWKPVQRCETPVNAPFLNIEPKALAEFLVLIYNEMVKHERPYSLGIHSSLLTDSAAAEVVKLSYPPYNQATFAFLLSVIKENIVTNWDKCVDSVYNEVFNNHPMESFELTTAWYLGLHMHLFGVDNGRFKTTGERVNISGAVLAPVLPSGELPMQLCVTIRVPRVQLRVLTAVNPEDSVCPAIICSFLGKNKRGDMRWINHFCCIQLAFGSWHTRLKDGDSYPCIVEDIAQLYGDSDMFVSVMVPTAMLLQERRFVPIVECGLMNTPNNYCFRRSLGNDLCFARNQLTSQNVFITKFMPGMSALPTLIHSRNQQSKPGSTTAVRLSHDGSQIAALTRRVRLPPWLNMTKPIVKSNIQIESKSMWTSIVSFEESFASEIDFPIPVSPSLKVKVTRKKTFIDIEAHFFNPLREESGSFLFPTFLTQFSRGVTVPALWSATRVDLDIMPQLDLNDKGAIAWLNSHISQMFSAHERELRQAKAWDVRSDLKEGIFSLFMRYAGLDTQPFDTFVLTKPDDDMQSLILVSCLRLDLVNHTVVLDCALIPPDIIMMINPRVHDILLNILSKGLCRINVSEDENVAWKLLMPAFVERCRTWSHTAICEYVEAGEVPLPLTMELDGMTPICSCGIGKFPSRDYLSDQKRRFSGLGYLLKHYGVRIGIAPIFGDSCIEIRPSMDSMR